MDRDIVNTIWPEWQIIKRIGRGSFGTVYEAVRKDSMVESHAAIKIISIPQDESEIDALQSDGLSYQATKTYLQNVVDDFVNEIRLMESFKGVQNIVSVEDYKVIEKTDELGWIICIRMELLTPFNNYTRNRTLSEQEVIKLGTDICTALELCSRRNVIHRDIKPGNIFVNQFGDFKLGDFGVARKLENVTGSLSQKGTYSYIAPEVEKGTQYDATVDIYSLGLVLYRLLNQNRLPFMETEQQLMNPNERMVAIRRRINGEQIPPPSEASPEMAEIILRACEYEPQNRFASAEEMKNALNAAANGTYQLKEDYSDDKTVVQRRVEDSVKNISPTEKKQKPEKGSIDTFGTKKKSGIPGLLIFGIILLVAGIAIAIPQVMNMRDQEESNKQNQPDLVVAEKDQEEEQVAASAKEEDHSLEKEEAVEPVEEAAVEAPEAAAEMPEAAAEMPEAAAEMPEAAAEVPEAAETEASATEEVKAEQKIEVWYDQEGIHPEDAVSHMSKEQKEFWKLFFNVQPDVDPELDEWELDGSVLYRYDSDGKNKYDILFDGESVSSFIIFILDDYYMYDTTSMSVEKGSQGADDYEELFSEPNLDMFRIIETQ